MLPLVSLHLPINFPGVISCSIITTCTYHLFHQNRLSGTPAGMQICFMNDDMDDDDDDDDVINSTSDNDAEARCPLMEQVSQCDIQLYNITIT